VDQDPGTGAPEDLRITWIGDHGLDHGDWESEAGGRVIRSRSWGFRLGKEQGENPQVVFSQ